MLATLVAEPFNRLGWTNREKYDGPDQGMERFSADWEALIKQGEVMVRESMCFESHLDCGRDDARAQNYAGAKIRRDGISI